MQQVIAFINNGTGERELPVSAENPLPVAAELTPPADGFATEVQQELQTALLTTIEENQGTVSAATFSVFRAPSSAPLTNTAQAIKASAGKIFGMRVFSPATNVIMSYLKFFNVAAVSVVPGTTVPVMVIPIPSYDSTGSNTGAFICTPDKANELQDFSTAISVLATSVLADTGTQTAPTTGLLVDAIQYQ